MPNPDKEQIVQDLKGNSDRSVFRQTLRSGSRTSLSDIPQRLCTIWPETDTDARMVLTARVLHMQY